MPRFTARYLLSPPGVFGLPDNDRIVVPANPAGRDVVTPVIDTRTGRISSHGSFSEYRHPNDAIELTCDGDSVAMAFRDNFCSVEVDAANAADAHRAARQAIDLFCQALGVQFGHRFSAAFTSLEDADGLPQRVPTTDTVRFAATWYNLAEARDRLAVAFEWAVRADDRARKALLYYEHACLLFEFADTLPPFGPHAAFAHGMAFLQLFKALVSIVGEPAVDRDYQSRAARIGLPKGFWEDRVRPLYRVRNDEDVAHHALNDPQPGAFLGRFREATNVFQEAFAAYIKSLVPRAV